MSYGDSQETLALKEQRAMRWVKFALKASGWITAAVVALIVLWSLVGPQLRLYRANTEKQAIITEARAQSEAAQFTAERAVEIATAEAEVDRVRAQGIADANELIAKSLTPEYIRWYFVDRLDDIDGQIIYVPTEAGVPLPEAGRAVK